ncbi:unnamed protein product [Nyctereutes procyonoides]|uniref:(raccoon dog) hypothetical protein n=1 Tax=Nyctereutes procyonoides TaxID=34880 RepID=A0A811YAS6_NYCPR|nr:unnamed protein product [Nyctereutes procyonoides]
MYVIGKAISSYIFGESKSQSFSGTQNSRKEAILLAKMKHLNIIAFKESFEAEGHLYIVIEYCDGGDLMQKIKHQKGKLFPEDMVRDWLTWFLSRVNHIHKKRVLHRDFKSKNIFLTQNGKVKLGDFGSARLLSNPMVFACTYVGTPYYVPPEIWENMPYNNKSWKSLILKICHGSMSPLPSQYSCELQHLIKQMFKRNPSHHPSAMTLLSRGSLAWLICKCLPPEIITEYSEQVLEETKNSKHDTPRKKIALENEATTTPGEEKGRKYSHTDLENINALSVGSVLRTVNKEKANPVLPSPLRRQWEKNVPNTALMALENATILSSSLSSTAGDYRARGAQRFSAAFSPGPDPGDRRSSSMLDSLHGACFSLWVPEWLSRLSIQLLISTRSCSQGHKFKHRVSQKT